jgi:hypothetical protein
MAKSNRPMVLIHNVTTGEVIEREMDDKEFAQYELDQDVNVSNKADAVANQAAKEAILERLGLTQAEAKLLIS